MRMVTQPTDYAGHTGSTESGRRITQAHNPGTEAGCLESEIGILVTCVCRLHSREAIEDGEEVVDALRRSHMRMVILPTDPAGRTGTTESSRRVSGAHVSRPTKLVGLN